MIIVFTFAVAAAFFYFRWVEEKREEEGECTEKR